MKKRPRIGFWTKLKANKRFLYEIQVEGSNTDTMLSGFNDAQYAAQVIRAGNCLSKINPIISDITADSFWNIIHFEELTQTVYWTFNEGFRLRLMEKMKDLPLPDLSYCLQKLRDNPEPYKYDEASPEFYDEEMKWAAYRNDRMSNQPEFKQIFELDKTNRKQILDELNKIILSRQPDIDAVNINHHEIPFPEMLKPVSEGISTLHFIREKIKQADFKFDPFEKIVSPYKNDSKPKHFNGCIAATLFFFFDYNYFHDKFTVHDIFAAYQQFSGNEIKKAGHIISQHKNVPGFKEHYNALKALKINKFVSSPKNSTF